MLLKADLGRELVLCLTVWDSRRQGLTGDSSAILSETCCHWLETLTGSLLLSVLIRVMTSNLMILLRRSPRTFHPPPPVRILKNFLEMNFFFFCYLIGLLKVGHLLTFRERFSIFPSCWTSSSRSWRGETLGCGWQGQRGGRLEPQPSYQPPSDHHHAGVEAFTEIYLSFHNLSCSSLLIL